jgi:hypothetical protein
MELLNDVPLKDSELEILNKMLSPEATSPLDELSQSAATILINLAINEVKKIVFDNFKNVFKINFRTKIIENESKMRFSVSRSS